MDWLVDLASGSGLASIVGLAGGMVSKWFEARAKRDAYKFQLESKRLEIAEAKLERTHELDMADKQMERAQVEGEIHIEGEELKAFASSQEYGNKIEGALRFVRPSITFYLLIAVSILFGAVWSTVGGLASFSPEQLVSLLHQMVDAAIYLTVMCIGWWFGSRPGGVFKR